MHHELFKEYNYIKNKNPFKGFDFDYYEVKHYYLLNILRTKINFDNINTVLEIGGGSGHFAILIKNYHRNIKNFLTVDIPEILIFNIIFMMFFFPNESFCLPNEINKNQNGNNFFKELSFFRKLNSLYL